MLKIDLLPAHFAVARTNKKLIVVGILVVAGVLCAWAFMLAGLGSKIADTQKQLDDTKVKADAVRKTQADTKAKNDELAPIKSKVDFIADADKSGAEFWDRFHKINTFIPAYAQVHSFSIDPPGSVKFTCTVADTTHCARFLLNFIRCPFVTGISISGLPKGVDIKAPGGSAAGGAAGGGGAPGGMGGGMPGMAGGGAPGGMGGGMPGMAGGGAPGGMGGGMPGMAGGGAPGGMGGGMPGMAGGGAPGGASAPSTGGTSGKIDLSVTCQLIEPINVPKPPGMAMAAAGGGGMPGMAGGGGMPGAPGGAMPGAPGGGGAGGMPGAPGAAKAGGKAKGEGKSDDEGAPKKVGKEPKEPD